MSEWWTDEDHAATVTALLDAWTKRGGSPHADATTLLAALAPTVDRIRREAKAEALREAADEAERALICPGWWLRERADRIESTEVES